MANLKPSQCLSLDANAQKNFIKFFATLGEKPSTTVRIFDRVDYYTVHGKEDTELVAKIIFRSTAFIKIMAPGEVEELSYVVLNKGNFENLIRELLLVKNYRVEVYTKSNKSKDWDIEFKGSPGNLLQFEDILFGANPMTIGTGIVSIQIKSEGNQEIVGLAYVESNDYVFSIMEFLDDDFFTELEATIVLLGPKECILPSAESGFGRIKTLMERNGVMVTIRKKTDFILKKSDLVQDLNNLLRFSKGQQENAHSLPEINKTIAMTALTAAIKYLDLIGDPANLGNFELKLLNLKRFVHLDAAAVSALNILPKPGISYNAPSYRWQSILGVLDRCRTPQGHRLMSQWVKQPLRNEACLKDRHDIVQCFFDSPLTLADLHDDYLKRMPDIMMLTKKLMRKKASLQDIYRIYQVLIRAPRFINMLNALENSSVKNVLSEPLKDTLMDLKMLKQMIEQVVDLDGVDQGEYLVKPTFDEQLKELKENLDLLQEKMEKLLEKAANELELDKGTAIKLDYVSHLGHHFRISLKNDEVLRKNSKYKILDAIKGGVRFTTDKLTELNQDFTELKLSYEEQQKTIVEEVVRVASGYMGPLTLFNNLIAQLDCLVSFAIAARNAPTPYVRPKMLSEGSGILTLKNARHPCLELQENVTYIANDVEFIKDETTMYIITGPNMGGKSTYIRSVGTAVLMAHIGSFVPCDNATISMVDSILGRIGANDNIIKGLSTFMVEMIETSGIIRTASDKSLVIIDELGRGTSTYEGCGIAWSIAEHLAKESKCFTLFATHFHEITEIVNYCPTVKNYHMTALADNENFTLLYQIKPGVMDKSFGIQVARLAHFPESTIEMAEKMYEEYEDKYSETKTEKDQIVIEELEKFIEERVGDSKKISDKEVENWIDAIKNKVRANKSTYMEKAFPALW